jgi:hypothetical protein
MTEWLARKLLRVFATATAVAGASLVGTAFFLSPLGGDQWSATIRVAASFVGGVLLIGGAAVAYLASTRRQLLPNERADTPAPTAEAGWLLLPALALIAITLWMFSRLANAMSLWQDIARGLDSLDIWRSIQEAPQYSGLYLAPLGLVVAAPALHAVAAAAFLVGTMIVLVLMAMRSSRLPRAFLILVLLQGALVFTGAIATAVAARAIPAVEQAIREIPDPDGEGARWQLQIRRYADATQSANRTLSWTWVAWALLLPMLVWSNRAAGTFAARRQAPLAPLDHHAVTEAEREDYFEKVARRIDSP